MSKDSVVVIGAGVAGLTVAALLAHEGLKVTLLEAQGNAGGCAGSFRRGPYSFDIGATQVAGLEAGGIHDVIFRYLNCPIPDASILNPGCVVDLADGFKPIELFYDPEKWECERKSQFPGTELFWNLCEVLHHSNWMFVSRNPILPVQSSWDLLQLLKAIRPVNLLSGLISKMSITDLLKVCRCYQSKRLREFLDLQLKLYSQESANRTAALYGATVLQMAQAPLGLWHLNGSMQKLSDALTAAFLRDGGELLLRHKVVRISKEKGEGDLYLDIVCEKQNSLILSAPDIICTLPPQCLLGLMSSKDGLPPDYRQRLELLPKPSGALVFYGALARHTLPPNCCSHMQLASTELGSIFASISVEGDGRAPEGEATVIASIFTDPDDWFPLEKESYEHKKGIVLSQFLRIFSNWLEISPASWLHNEIATPRSFARWTGRPKGIVGGLGQHPSQFGPFGLPSRTPVDGLWIGGDSIYPGEGTAGVSQSSVMIARQVLARKGRELKLTL